MLGLKTVRGCFGGVVMVALLGVAAFAGWRWGDPLFERVAPSASTTAPQPTRELAEATLERFEALRRGEAGDRLALGSLELESVLRYGVPQMVPPGVSEPMVRLGDGQVRVGGEVAVEAFPRLPDEVGRVIGFLPDTMRIEVGGTLSPLDERRAQLVVHDVRAVGIPLPDRMIHDILRTFGREDVPGLPGDAMSVPLPTGIESVWVERDRLVLRHGG